LLTAFLSRQRLLWSRQIEPSSDRTQSEADLARNLTAAEPAAIRFSNPCYSTNPSSNSGGFVGATLAPGETSQFVAPANLKFLRRQPEFSCSINHLRWMSGWVF